VLAKPWRVAACALIGAAFPVSSATAAVADGLRLVPPPAEGDRRDRLATTVFFDPGEAALSLELRAYRLGAGEGDVPAPVRAKAAKDRDAAGSFRLVRPVGPPANLRVDVELAVDRDELDLPAESLRLGYVLQGKRDGRVVFTAASPVVIATPSLPGLPAPTAPSKTPPAATAPGPTFYQAGPPDQAAPGSVSLDEVQPDREKRTIYFATNRRAVPGPEPRPLADLFANEPDPAASLSFGQAEVNIPIFIDGMVREPGTLPVASWWRRRGATDPRVFFTYPARRLDRAAFLASLLPDGPGRPDDLLVFVHGFNTRMDDAALRLAQLAHDTGFLGRAVLFAWPSQGRLLLAPGESWLPGPAYARDESMAGVSGKPLAGLLRLLIEDRRAKAPGDGPAKIHLIAHSMGNRVLLAAIRDLDATLPAGSKPFGQVVLAAPDVGRGQFFDSGLAIGRRAEGLTIYSCSEDWALRTSRALHYRPPGPADPRLGEYGFVHPQIPADNVDATRANTSWLGHDAYASSRRLLIDLRLLLRFHLRAADRKATLRPALPHQATEWRDLPYWLFEGPPAL